MADIPYNRPQGRRQYVSTAKHQAHSTNKHSNKWTSVNIERQVFDIADYGGYDHSNPQVSWTDSNGNMWGFLNGFATVGLNGEQFGYFENPNNEVLQWHGFPIIPFSQSRYAICNILLTLWVNSGFFDEDDIPALLNKKRIR